MKKTVIIAAAAVCILVLSGVLAVYITKRNEAENPEKKPVPAAQTQGKIEVEKPEMSFAGDINGNLKIHMNLKFEGSDVSGTYFYEKYKSNIKLKGTKDNSGNLVLNEIDAKGNKTGIFTGKFTSGSKIEGTWSKPDGTNKMPFSLIESNEPAKEENKQDAWAGEWGLVGATQFYGSTIKIKDVTASDFKFSLFANSGANMGQMEDSTAKMSKNSAVFKDGNKFKITFTLVGNTMKVKTENSEGQFGAGVSIDGEYKKGIKGKTLTLKDVGVFTSNTQEQQFKKLVGKRYEKFESSFHIVNEEKDIDSLGTKVYTGFVSGIGDSAIIMYTPDGKLWAAVLDSSLEYYTNVGSYKGKMPKTIEEWTKKFNGANLRYMNN